MTNPKVALVLAGCGAKDGAEITEAVSLLIAFSQENFNLQLFAPDRPLHHVVDHKNNLVCEFESRNILTEAARIARGKILPLSQLSPNEFDVLSFSGGFGVAKNFCDFAFAGSKSSLNQDISDIITSFIQSSKVVSALCIAPILIALAAKELKLKNAQITLGEITNDASKVAKSWGIEVVDKKVDEACIDFTNKFVTSPAYMFDLATPADIYASSIALVQGIKTLLK